MPRFSVQPDSGAAGPEVKAVVNSATYAPRVAPGSIVSIFGTNLEPAPVLVNGRTAPVFYSGPTQINAQLPFEAAPGPATVQVGSSSFTIQVDAAAPGIFMAQADRAVAQPVRPGEYATVYLTGQGEVSPPVPTGQPAPASPFSLPKLPVSVTVGGVAAVVQFAGLAPGYVGLMQLNLRVPMLPAGNHPVIVTIGGASSNAALIPVESAAASWQANMKVSKTGAYAQAGRTYASSSSLLVQWKAPDAVVHHYVIAVSEKRSSVRAEAPGNASETTVRGLKAGTTYSVSLRACLDTECTVSLPSVDSASSATEEEYWAIQGTGNSYATADHLIADGNVGSHAFRYGPWAGPALDGKIQLYYNPLQADEKGVKIAELVAARAQSVRDALAFRGVSGYGLARVCQPINGATPPECAGSTSLATGLNLFQAVPLASGAGGKVRLYFEAQAGDGRTRILYLDSQDGYIGRDFHSGAPTRCSSLADYSAGGGCEPKIAVGVDIDGQAGNPNILNARQFKIAYPTQDSWAWDMKPGTLMWFTTEWQDGRCSTFGFNAAYAAWSGARWNVAYRSDGCPKLLPGAQAPASVHLGGARYKLYFNLHPSPSGPSDPRVALKPMRMLYADPEATGDPAVAEFEDWEPLSSARQVRYLWPNGDLLTEDEQSRLDDYVILAPTSDPERLVMYSNMSATGTQALPFIGSAVLVNP
jgi:uncharacterized protein (TIGR03437 family)